MPAPTLCLVSDRLYQVPTFASPGRIHCADYFLTVTERHPRPTQLPPPPPLSHFSLQTFSGALRSTTGSPVCQQFRNQCFGTCPYLPYQLIYKHAITQQSVCNDIGQAEIIFCSRYHYHHFVSFLLPDFQISVGSAYVNI